MGTLAKIEQVLQKSGDTLQVVVRGLERFRIDHWCDTAPFLSAHAIQAPESAKEDLEEVPGHEDSSGRLEATGREFILSEDADCEGTTGRYAWEIIGNTLKIDVLEDGCTPRETALTGQ